MSTFLFRSETRPVGIPKDTGVPPKRRRWDSGPLGVGKRPTVWGFASRGIDRVTARLLQGSVFDVLPKKVKRGSVDVAVTSPPYFNLRSYLPNGHKLKRHELGSEKSPAKFIENMVRVFDLVRDCLADHGTCWINIGDSYSHDSRGGETGGKHMNWHHDAAMSVGRMQKMEGIETGNLCLIPQRLAIALQDDGWLVRSYVVWAKPSPMPQSLAGWFWRRCRIKVDGSRRAKEGHKHRNATVHREHGGRNGDAFDSKAVWQDCPGCKKCLPNDGYVLRRGSWRPTSSWEPVLMLAKSAEYFADGEPVKTICSDKTFTVNTTPRKGEGTESTGEKFNQWMENNGGRYHTTTANVRDVWRLPLTDLTKEELLEVIAEMARHQAFDMPDVWRIAAEPLREKHFAAFPSELVRRCLLAGTSAKGYCPTCGKPWVRVIESKSVPHPSPRGAGVRSEIDSKGGNQANGSASLAPDVKTIGWRPSCKCPELPPRPGLVLDPFAGSGRTLLTAQRLGLDSIGIDLNPEYVAMAERKLREESPLFMG